MGREMEGVGEEDGVMEMKIRRGSESRDTREEGCRNEIKQRTLEEWRVDGIHNNGKEIK